MIIRTSCTHMCVCLSISVCDSVTNVYIFAALPKFAFETLMKLQSEPTPWGKMIQLLPFVAHEDVLPESEKSQN